MEERRVRSLVVVFVILGLLVGQSTASFKVCYPTCFLLCVGTGGNVLKCGFDCLKKCISPSKSLNGNLQQSHYFCKLGCATSSCSNLSTRDNPRGEEVASCVDSCSAKCTKNYSP